MAFLKKYVFLQALLLTVVMFLIGMYVGIVFEDRNLDSTEALFSQSEISLMDIISLNNIIDSEDLSCDFLIASNFEVADKIYGEALRLEDYERAGRLTDNLVFVHRKYDLLRTYLWMNAIKVKERCPGNFSTVIYLYNYELEDLTIRAKQIVWSKILYNLKANNPSEVLLIPIANSDDFISLDILTKNFQIRDFPVLIINEEHVIYDVTSSEDLEKYLN